MSCLEERLLKSSNSSLQVVDLDLDRVARVVLVLLETFEELLDALVVRRALLVDLGLVLLLRRPRCGLLGLALGVLGGLLLGLSCLSP